MKKRYYILSRPENRALKGTDELWPLKYSASKTPGFSPGSFVIVLAIMLLFCNLAFAEDGNYDAFVTTKDGTYSASVVVESNKVTIVRWPQGGFTLVSTEEIVAGVAKGTDSDGNPISVEAQDYY